DSTHFTYTAASGLANATGGTATAVYPITVTITEVGSGPLVVNTTATIAESSTDTFDLTGAPVEITAAQATEGVAFTNLPVATFTDPVDLGGLADPVSEFQAIINWGDSVVISSATESGTTATITTAYANNFQTGQTVVIAGVSVGGYNGSFTITVV